MSKKQKVQEVLAKYLSQVDEADDFSESDEEKELVDLKPSPLKRSVLQSPKEEKTKDLVEKERVDFESLTQKMNEMMQRMEMQDAKLEAKAKAKADKQAKADKKAEAMCPVVKEEEQKCPEPERPKDNKFHGLF
jgi:hypothetical protein